MTEQHVKDIFEKRGQLEEARDLDCSACGPALVFALQAGENTVSLDLPTLLQCLYLAEQKASVPKLSAEWWNSVINHYNIGSSIRKTVAGRSDNARL
ncbi:hypothetical protein AUP42_01750 [Thalassospira lucentensis]|uniref:Uncharacterized protein n=1 Tax=Thalassospira lucentensis TaxID=168935 RepID=A0A154L5H5_9PROT|nr:hypothetical protein [Thalassospira lucentensis]KZB63142.1 hypothetical protein AUP42_01750 [Thalassospira lucentensis]